MSRRIVDKLKHPILDALRKSSVTDIDLEQSKKSYEETYLKKISPRADHVESDT